MKINMKKIMIFIGSYLPGTKSAGVMTSISNMVKTLNKKFEFYIVTGDRDIGESKPYENVKLEQWTKYEETHIYYSGKYINSLNTLKKIVNSVDVDLYYFNGFYNKRDTARVLMLWKLKQIKRKPIIIAPCGIFNMGNASKYTTVRCIYRCIFRMLSFDKTVFWHATSEIEERKIKQYFPRSENKIFIVDGLSGIVMENYKDCLTKNKGKLKIIFVSRISEKKNLKFIIDVLSNIEADLIEWDVYGIIGSEDDRRYWEECKQLAKKLPPSICVTYRGEVPHSDVKKLFMNHHLFFFPTLGENYGHVIAESIAYQCPVLLSDTTPWNDLYRLNAGWIVPLNNKKKYVEIVQQIVDMDNKEWHSKSLGAWKAAHLLIDSSKSAIEHEKMFNEVGKRYEKDSNCIRKIPSGI